MPNPTLSIHCITYNHEKFIAQAMDGFLMQKTTFDFEIVVGEDCSTDNTRRILLEYKEKHPDKIKLLLNEKNLGMQQNGMQTGAACTGKYLAICEGDDYWTDPLKLQKQVDFLEANPNFAICFHNVEVKHEDGETQSYLSNSNQKQVTTFEDLAAENYIHTVSCVFRKPFFEFPEWFYESAVGDWVTHLLNAEHGKIAFIDEVMAVYRVHKGGVWSMQDLVELHLKWVSVVETCRKHFYPRAQRNFSRNLADTYCQICFVCFESDRYKEFRQHYLECIRLARYFKARIFLVLTVRYLLSFTPRLAAWYKNKVSR